LLFNASGDLTFKIVQQDKDLNIKGNDGGSEITALTLDMSEAGAATFNDKVILGANKSIEFGDSGENISGDGTNLLINSGGYTELTSTGNILLNGASVAIKDGGTNILQIDRVSNAVTLTSRVTDDDIKFRGNDGSLTALTLDMSDAGTATFNNKIILNANKVIEFGDSGETISGDGTAITVASSEDITLDAASEINLDAGSDSIRILDDGVQYGRIHRLSGGGLVLKSQESDKDIQFQGVDGGSGITALTLDMSAAGNAYFNNNIIIAKDADATNNKILLGAAADGESGDLEVYHDGNHSHIRDRSTGNLRLRSTKIVLASDSMSYLEATNAGSVDIYHNSSKKFETTSAGATVTGGLKISDDGTIGNTTTANAMTIEAAGQVTFVGDIGVGDDIFMGTNGALISMGAANISRIIHQSDGFIFKSLDTGDDNPFVLTLQTGETDIAANDVLGKIDFQAPDEGTGTDAILVAAGIEAVSEGDFSSSSNATKLSFKTAASEAASEKMSLSSAGNLTVSGTVTANGEVLTAGVSAGFAVAMAIAL